MNKKFNKIILLSVVLFVLISCIKFVQGATVTKVTPVNKNAKQIRLKFTSEEPVDLKNNLFCAQHGYRTALLDSKNNTQSEVIYIQDGESDEVELTTGYALWKTKVDRDDYNSSRYSLQHVIWRSSQFDPNSNVVEEGNDNSLPVGHSTSLTPVDNLNLELRANDYGIVYHQILKKTKGGDQLFTSETKEEELKVMVDQTNGTYTVGPYKLSLNIKNASEEAKEILYNELIGSGNAGFTMENRFAKPGTVAGLRGDNPILLNNRGEEIVFPNFVNQEEFYIRFNPHNGGDIPDIGFPKLRIKYMEYKYAKVIRYVPYKFIYKHTFTRETSSISYEEHRGSEAYGYANANKTIQSKSGDTYKVNVTTPLIRIKWDNDDERWYLVNNNQYVEIDLIANGLAPTIQKTREITITRQFEHKEKIPETEYKIRRRWEKEYDYDYSADWFEVRTELKSKKINIKLGGNVWYEVGDTKTNEIDGLKREKDIPYGGVLVQLFDSENNLISATTTDKDGKYQFEKLNPLKKYYVRFVYNGQLYQSTFYKNDLSGGYSNAKDEGREEFNTKFVKIDSTPQNYKVESWKKSYAVETKLAREDGEYIAYNNSALKYKDAWVKFLEFSVSEKSYDKAYGKLEEWMSSLGVGQEDKSGVITFIKDCFINATTRQNNVLYPVYDRFVIEKEQNPPDEILTVDLDVKYFYLYTKKSDQSRYVDFGLTSRENTSLAIQKDVYKVRVVVNGKIHDFYYNKKDSKVDQNGSWEIAVRASDALYNGQYTYSREIRKSEYLYTGNQVGQDSAKDLKVYVTYRIGVKNLGETADTVNEIVDYYDSEQFEFDGKLNGDSYSINSYNNYDENGGVKNSYVNSYIGDRSGNKISDITVRNRTIFADREAKKILSGANYKYDSLYLTGIKTQDGKERFSNGDIGFAYLTFKVKNDEATGKVKLDQDLLSGAEKAGKKNIAEINGYSTYYNESARIPNELTGNNERNYTNVSNKNAGIVDLHSRAGSLTNIDLDGNGNLRTDTNNEVNNRIEPDTDKASNIKLVIDRKNENNRTFSGITYEDARSINSQKTQVGNGVFNENDKDPKGNTDKLINGLTVELVELVQNVDSNGISLNTYNGEYIWSTMTYDLNSKTWTENNNRYFSGSGNSKVILTGNGILNVEPVKTGNGEYAFNSIPTGDYLIRFKYGDNEQTVLKNDDNEVNALLNKKGLNSRSYNGQDFKTTVYQKNINQNTNYVAKGIKGFVNYDLQNYIDFANKQAMYYYDIEESSKVNHASDAKDVYSYRNKVINYSPTLLNEKAEILNSFEKLGTFKYVSNDLQKADQQSKINELINNTAMVAQTGVINTEVEYNRTSTGDQENNNSIEYQLRNIDLGLQERAEAQLKLTKSVGNVELVLANGTTLFNTNKSVNNLYYQNHRGHTTGYKDSRMITPSVSMSNIRNQPESIRMTMDDELLTGATIAVTYDIRVDNVGEIDYLDKKFYYLGVTDNESEQNISRTNALATVDYVSNAVKYNKAGQNADSNWDLVTPVQLTISKTNENRTSEDFVNRYYFDELSTYQTLLATNKLSGDLLPETTKKDSSRTTSLKVSTLLSGDKTSESMVFNNLAEIIKTSNTMGRRNQYSIVGNQEMADQSLGNNASSEAYSHADLVTPTEIDADSAQKVSILPPTGENRNYIIMIVTILVLTIGAMLVITYVKTRKRI